MLEATTKQEAVEKKASFEHLNQVSERALVADALLFYLQFGDLEPDEQKKLARYARRRFRQLRVNEVEVVQNGKNCYLRQT